MKKELAIPGTSPNMMRWLIVALVFASACGDYPTGDAGEESELNLLVVSGDGQEGPAGEELPEPLVVQVLGRRSFGPLLPVKGQIVNFRVVEGGGSVFAGVATTNHEGIANDFWTLGDPGPQRVEARAVNSDGQKQVFGVFTATATGPPSPPLQPQFIQCLDQNGTWKFDGSCGWPALPKGSTFNVTFRAVAIVDDVVRGAPGAPMEFEIDPTCLGSCVNPGSVSPSSGFTDSSGKITVAWTLGPNVGSNRLIARLTSGSHQAVGVWVTGM